MSIDYSNVKAMSDHIGNIVKITDASGMVLWKQAPSEATVTIKGYGGFCHVTIDGKMYVQSTTLTVPIGTTIRCYLKVMDEDKDDMDCYIAINGKTVATPDQYHHGMGSPYYYTEYYYTVNGNVEILLEDGYYEIYISITEQ